MTLSQQFEVLEERITTSFPYTY
jgi:hypothetical protein